MASPRSHSTSSSIPSPRPSPSLDHQISIPVVSLPPPDPLIDPIPHHSILFLGFNQDCGRFACGTSSGFRVYDCDSFKEVFSRETSEGGGIGVVELLFRSNIVALVGGGPNPKYSPNKAMIWDDHQMQCIGELSFRSQVLSVKLRRDRIVVVLESRIYVYNFADLKLLLQIETIANPKGLCAISSTTNPFIIACPGVSKGQVRIELPGGKQARYISAHDSSIWCLALTFDGHLLATASSKGTLIRIFNTMDGTKLQEVRRGLDKAQIYSISFSPNAHWLAVSSDKGTVHVFSIKAEAKDECNKSTGYDGDGNNAVVGSSIMSKVNPGSTFSFIKGVLPKYFSSEWSFCQYRLPEEVRSIVAFGPEKHTIIIVGSDGSFYRCAFDPVNGGEMVEHERGKYFQP